jgi:tetratricopeptide (TPR) repeat protein
MSARPLFLTLIFAALALAPPARAVNAHPPQAATAARQKILDEMFAKLREAPDPQAAAPIRAIIEQLWRQSGSPTGDLLMTRAESLLKANLASRAGALLDQIVQLYPDWSFAWRRRAQADLLQGDSEGAMLDLDHALSVNPRNFVVMVDLAHLMRAAGRNAPALELLRRALSFDPQNDDTRRAAEELQRRIDGQRI